MENPTFGRIEHVAICDDASNPKYDQPMWVERIGAVCIPLLSDGRIVLVKQLRHVLATAEQPYSVGTDLRSLGHSTWELPRGFSEENESLIATATREVEEETGCSARETHLIGFLNTNTTYHANPTAIALVRIAEATQPIADLTPHRSPEQNETVSHLKLVTLYELKRMSHDGQVICGMTKAALFSYIAWLEFNTR